jgi:hypothetical protein
MGSPKEKRIFRETGKSRGKEAFSSSADEPCCQKETVGSDEGTVGGTQEAGESCVISEPGSGELFPDTCDCCGSSFVRPYPSLGTARLCSARSPL